MVLTHILLVKILACYFGLSLKSEVSVYEVTFPSLKASISTRNLSWIDRGLILGSLTNQSLIIGKGHIGWSDSIALPSEG